MNRTTISFLKTIHQWAGLFGGWFLFLVLVSGTLSLFDTEITQWMEPEQVMAKPGPLSSNALNQAYRFWTYNQNSPKNLITLPSSRDPYLHVLHIENKLMQDTILDPNQGNHIPVRMTAGGAFIDSLHKSLYMDRYWGGLILMTLSIFFTISILTGIILYHKEFLKTVFNLHPKAASLRILLNYHTTIGILLIPFLLVSALGGFLFLAPHYLSSSTELPQQHTHPFHSPASPIFLTKPQDLLWLIKQTESYFNHPAGLIFITPTEIKITEAESSHLTLLKNYLAFDRKTGKMTPHVQQLTFPYQIQNMILGIHKNRSGGPIMRIVSFIAGSCSVLCLMTGLLYYSNRYKNKNGINKYKRIYYRIINGISTGITMGTLISFVAYFWINRLIPVDQPNRMSYEISLFFIVFFMTFLYSIITALLNDTNKNLKKLLIILGNLCLLLPCIDVFTNISPFKTALLDQNPVFISIDMVALLFGLLFLKFHRFLQKKEDLS